MTLSKTSSLVSSMDHDPRFACVIETFLQEFPHMIQQLLLAFQHRNAKELSVSSHKIKGASGSAGFEFITQLALQIERFARARQIDSVEPLINQLRQLSEQITEQRKSVSQTSAAQSSQGPNS